MQNQDFYQIQEEIEQLIKDCETAKINKSKDAKYKLKKLTQKINYYDGYVQDQSQRAKIELYRKKAKQIQQLGMTADYKTKLQDLDQAEGRAKDLVNGIKDDIVKANTQGEQIIFQLYQQMEELDKIKQQNMNTKIELKRIKSSLNTLLRGVMTDKCTCGLLILLLLGVVAVLVIYFVRKNQAA